MGLYFWLRGEVRLALRCRWPERALNLAAREGVRFRALAVTEEGVELTTSPRDARALLRLAERTGLFSAAVLARRGLPFLLWGLRRRRALAAGLALSLLLLILSNFYIWQIEVYGNETVPTAELLSALREEGVHTGLSVFAVDRVGVSLGLLRRVPALSWATVNVRGSRVWVLVREAKPAPEMLTGDAPAALVAARDGTITDLTVLSGRALFRRGDSVRAGETLIEGTGERALGSVTARTRHTLTEAMPLSCAEKRYTGGEARETGLIFGDVRVKISFMGSNPPGVCDKIREERLLTLPGGSVLPVGLLRETWREALGVPGRVPFEEAERILRARLLARLAERLGEGGIERETFSAWEKDDVLYVRLEADCVEEIAKAKEENTYENEAHYAG